MSEKANIPLKDDDISLRDILLKIQEWGRFLIRKWKWMLLFAVVGAISGLTYALLKTTEYTATLSFVTDTKNPGSSGLGAYAGLAAQLGLNVSSSGFDNELFSGDNIFDLMKTRLILKRTLLTPVTIEGKQILLIDRYIDIEKLKEKNPGLEKISFRTDSSSFTPSQNGAIKSISSAILKKMEYKSGPIMVVSFTSRDELFSLAFLETLMQNVGEFYVGTKTEKARENLEVLQRQLDSVRTQLYGAMGNVASFQDVNPNLVRQGPRVQQQKSTLKVNINSSIYQQLVTALESAKMTLQKETPLFKIIDEPVLPLENDKPSKLKWALVGGILGLLLCGGWLLFRRIYYEIITG